MLFRSPEVVAVNKFRRRMHGQPEIVRAGDSGRVVVVERGTKGAVLINLSDGEQTVSLPSALPDGNYVDKVHNSSFTVNNGELSGKLAPLASYIITGRGVAI